MNQSCYCISTNLHSTSSPLALHFPPFAEFELKCLTNSGCQSCETRYLHKFTSVSWLFLDFFIVGWVLQSKQICHGLLKETLDEVNVSIMLRFSLFSKFCEFKILRTLTLVAPESWILYSKQTTECKVGTFKKLRIFTNNLQ